MPPGLVGCSNDSEIQSSWRSRKYDEAVMPSKPRNSSGDKNRRGLEDGDDEITAIASKARKLAIIRSGVEAQIRIV